MSKRIFWLKLTISICLMCLRRLQSEELLLLLLAMGNSCRVGCPTRWSRCLAFALYAVYSCSAINKMEYLVMEKPTGLKLQLTRNSTEELIVLGEKQKEDCATGEIGSPGQWTWPQVQGESGQSSQSEFNFGWAWGEPGVGLCDLYRSLSTWDIWWIRMIWHAD